MAARFDGGVITREALHRAAVTLPPDLRARFQTEAGKRALAMSLVDRQLLLREAERRHLDLDPDIRRKVEALKDRLLIRALVANALSAKGKPSEKALRSYYEAHEEDFRLPERVRIGRVLLEVPPGASAAVRAARRRKAETARRRLRSGDPMSKVAMMGDGPERVHGGELGTFTRSDLADPALRRAAFSLEKSGEISQVVATAKGWAVVRLIQKIPPHLASFESVRDEVSNRLSALRQRQTFDTLRKRLRAQADIHIEVSARQ